MMREFSRAAIFVALGIQAANAQALTPKIDLPLDSPVAVLSADFSSSTATPRGGMYVVDVRGTLSLVNTTQQRIRGITLAVYAPGGKGSFSVPSLNIAPGEAFPIQIENHLLRPLAEATGGPTVEVKLDGVLFDNLDFYGPDTLGTQRQLKRWELEARRDRKYYRNLLETAGAEGLRKEMLTALAQQNDRRGLNPGVQIVRGRATNIEAEREVQFAFATVPNSPVEATGGTARVSASEARAPHFSVRNRGNRPVEHIEFGWIVKDQQGREFFAATVPADLKLAPQQSGEIREDSALRFQKPVAIQTVTGFISNVEFADGNQWIPPHGHGRGMAPPSPEETRLLNIYNKKGIDALIAELKKFD